MSNCHKGINKFKLTDASLSNSKFDKKRLEYKYSFKEGNKTIMVSDEFNPANIDKIHLSIFSCEKGLLMMSFYFTNKDHMMLRKYVDGVFKFKMDFEKIDLNFPEKIISYDNMKLKMEKLKEFASKVE